MAGRQHKSKKELQRESRELELTERRVFLGLSVTLTVTTVVGPFFGMHWAVPAGAGIGAGLSAVRGRFTR
jgi:hypothetical protein